MSKFLSGRQSNLKLGVGGYTESKTVLETTGKVGIGTTDAQQHSLFVVGSTNITGDTIVGGGLTAVGIGSFQSDVYIDNQLYVGGVNITGGASVGEDIVTRNLKATGISTFVGITTSESHFYANDQETVGVATFVGAATTLSAQFKNNVHIDSGVYALFGNSIGKFSIRNTVGKTQLISGQDGGNIEILSQQPGSFIKIGKYSGGANDIAVFNVDGSVDLYYDTDLKFQTIGTGATVYGTLFADEFSASGIITATAFHGAIKIDESEDDNAAYNIVFTDTTGEGDPTNPHHALQIDNNGLTFNPGTNTLFSENALHSGNIGLGAYLYHSGDVDTFIGFPVSDKITLRTDGVDKITVTAIGVTLSHDGSQKFETTGIGVSISNGGTDTATIAGPENLIIDPAAVGDNTGIVRIKGDLYIDGTEFKVDSSTINLADLKIGIATNVGTSLLLDGGGIGIGDPDVAGLEKTLLWNHVNNRMEFNANLYAPNFYTGNIEADGDVDIDGHTELDGLRVSGVSTFQSDISVGSAITAYAATGIVSAIAFYGDGSNLTNTGATLSASSGVERLVTTQLTSGTMVDAATDADLTFDAGNNTLNTENIKISGGISTNGTNYGSAGQLLRSASGGKWEWATVPGIFSVNNILNGFNVLEEGGTVGTAGSIHTLDFRGINVTASGDPQPNGIATITFSTTPTFDSVTVNDFIDLDGDLNVTGVSTFQNNVHLLDDDKLLIGGSVGTHDGLEIYHDSNHSYIDDSGTGNLYLRSGTLAIQNLAGSKTSALFQSGGGQEFYHNNTKRLETTGYGVTVYNDLRVGTAVTIYGNAGIVSATAFYGDGSNLSNTGATLSAAAGTQRLVVTSLTSGTMVDAATDSDLSYNATTDTLNLENIDLDGHAELDQLRVSGVSTFQAKIEGAATNNVIPFLYSNFTDLPNAGTYHGAFAHVHATQKAYFAHANAWYELVNKDLNGVVGTGTETYNIANINITGITTLGGPVTAGSSEGVNGQYLRHVGTGVTWANFPTLRTVGIVTSSGGETTFAFNYNVDFLDVFVNGVKLTPSEYTATNGTQIALHTPTFANEIVEFHSYNTTSTYSGGGGGGGGGGSSTFIGLTDTPASFASHAGKFVKVNSSANGLEFDFVSASAPVGTGGTFAVDTIGINTTKSVGIGTTAKDGYKLYVEGDARVTGILTVGPASVTIDGINNEVSVGAGITLYGNTGIISATSLNVTGALSGDGSSLTGLTGASAATYGNGTAVPQITVDANGRITTISNVLISGGGGGGSSVIIKDSQSIVGTAGTIDFGTGLSVSPVSAGIVTVTADFDLTDLSVTTNSAGSAALSYNNSSGVFTYTPPDLSSYLTSYTETDPVVGAVNGIVKANGSGTISAATAGTDYLQPGGEFTSQWTFSASGSSNYQVTGPGFAANSSDPTIYVTRGHKYKFKNNAGGHPLQIQYEFENASGTAYTDGITNSNNVITWEVRNDAPDLLHYQCTSHSGMSGRIVVLGDVVSNGSWTASAGTPQTIDTITGVANNAIKTAEYVVHIENGSNMQAQKVLVMQDGTTAFSQEYAIMHKSGLLVSMSATISGGDLLLQATPETGVSGTTTYKITRQTMR